MGHLLCSPPSAENHPEQVSPTKEDESVEGYLSMWYLYILECSDKTLYTGITNDLEKRVEKHNSSNLGAKYTRSRRPVKLVYSRRFKSKSKAAKEENSTKKLSRKEKINLINK